MTHLQNKPGHYETEKKDNKAAQQLFEEIA